MTIRRTVCGGLLVIAAILCLGGCKPKYKPVVVVYDTSMENTWSAVRSVVRLGAEESSFGTLPLWVVQDVSDQDHWLVTKWFYGGKTNVSDPKDDHVRYRYDYYRARISCTPVEGGTQVLIRYEGASYESEHETGPDRTTLVADRGAEWSTERFVTALSGKLGEPKPPAKAGPAAPTANSDAPKPEAK